MPMTFLKEGTVWAEPNAAKRWIDYSNMHAYVLWMSLVLHDLNWKWWDNKDNLQCHYLLNLSCWWFVVSVSRSRLLLWQSRCRRLKDIQSSYIIQVSDASAFNRRDCVIRYWSLLDGDPGGDCEDTDYSSPCAALGSGMLCWLGGGSTITGSLPPSAWGGPLAAMPITAISVRWKRWWTKSKENG